MGRSDGLSIVGQTGSLGISPGFHTTTSSTDFNYYSSPVNTVSHATPHVPNTYNDPNGGYSHDTRYGQYNNIVPQQPLFRPPNPPRPEIMEVRNRARENQKPYSDFYDVVPYPPNYKIPEFTKFSGEYSRTTYEHVDQFLAQCGRASSMNTYSVPYPQRFEVSNFTKFTGEDAITTIEHIGQFIEQCDASLMEQRPIDTSSVTCETISVTSIPKTGIVSDPLPVSSIDVDKKKGKSVIWGSSAQE
uniref:Retrotransposon protein, putative, Ty3-gypsy subclass n=2 Tax=Oryza sativa subsp. japonica TaxID=39947 RepID=Q84NY8_ORYSJ|nr:hypothetical protein [Oryza sativa Japonica Group]ABF97296.1 retrotransposon protein, putative, Ty3-gypsy subclass [Oryza sativa Japonica Group]